jgi:O-antigen/teichoic acid export membrane protein
MAPLDNTMIGNYKVALNFAVLLTFLTGPIGTVLFPLFSKVDSTNEKGILKTVFSSSVKYTILLVTPATMALIVLASPLIGTLYGNKYSFAPPFLALCVVFNLFSLLGWRSMGQFLPAVGETKLIMKMNLLALVISIPLAFILIPTYGIVGLILGPIISAIPSTFIGLYLSWKRYGVKADFISSGKIFIASLLASGTVYVFISFFHLAFWELFLGGIVLFVCVYLISAPLIGAINRTDVKNLRDMFAGIGVISKILDVPLKIIERLLRSPKTQEPREDQNSLPSESLKDIMKTAKAES